MQRALIDTNIFISNWTLDLLLSFAEADIIDVAWSDAILAELMDVAERLGKAEGICNLIDQANRAYPAALVEGWERHLPTIDLPDPDDRHVLAAAIEGSCDTIVTFNLRDFPQASLEPYGIRVISPDDLAMELVHSDPLGVLGVVEYIIRSKRRPPRTYDQEIEGLRRCGLPKFATWLDS